MLEADPVPPIIVSDHGDLVIFASVEATIRYLEPIDVLHDEYELFDSRARRLDAIVEEGSPRIDLVVAPDAVVDRPALRALVVRFIRMVGPERLGLDPADIDGQGLERLIAALPTTP